MSYIKLTTVQKKIYKFIKQKLNSLERAEAARKSPYGSSQSTLPNVYKAGTCDERIWTSIFRCLGVSTDGKLHQTPSPRELLKNFWNTLSPHLLKDERKLKTLWFKVKGDSATNDFMRGINTPSWSDPDKKSPKKETQSGEPQKREPPPKTPPAKTSHGTARDDLSEQAMYILDYPPKKLISSKQKTKQAEQRMIPFELSSPVTRCRLSCPLPPTEFLPPERALYIPNFQPPNVKYAILQSVFLPHDKSSGEKQGAGGSTIKTPENESEKPQLGDVSKPPEKEPIKENPPENNVTKVSENKKEQMASEGGGGVTGEEKGETSVPPVSPAPLVDTLDIPEFMPDNTRKRKNIFALTNAKSQNYTAPEIPDIPQMNALLFNTKEMKLQYTAVEAPTKIHKDEVLVKVSYAGVTNYDLLLVEGMIHCEQDTVIPGREVSGIVYAVGSGVDHVQPGDKIVVNAYSGCSACRNCSKGLHASCLNGGINNSLGVSKNGGWAEFVVVKKTEVHKVPDELGLDKAVLIMLLSCILSAQKKLNLSYDSNVFIQGLGVSGMLWASLLHSRGFRNVYVSDKNEKRRTQFDSLNLKYSFLPPDDIRKYSADVIVECTGASSSIEKALRILNPNGQICLFGKSSPTSEIRCLPFEIALREITIVGNGGNNLCFSEAIDLAAILSSTYLNLEKLGVQAFKLYDYQRAFLMTKYEQIGKVVFTPET